MSYHHGDLKTALVEAGLRLLDEKGTEALSLRTLAAEVGVSHMAPYAHFKNKNELFQSIAANGFRSLSARMDQVRLGQAPSTLILDYGAEYIKFAIANAPLYRLMLAQTQVLGPEKISDSPSHLSEELQEASRRPFVLLLDAFEQAISDADDVAIRAQGAWAIVHGIASLLIDGHLTIPEGMDVKAYLAAAATQVPR